MRVLTPPDRSGQRVLTDNDERPAASAHVWRRQRGRGHNWSVVHECWATEVARADAQWRRSFHVAAGGAPYCDSAASANSNNPYAEQSISSSGSGGSNDATAAGPPPSMPKTAYTSTPTNNTYNGTFNNNHNYHHHNHNKCTNVDLHRQPRQQLPPHPQTEQPTAKPHRLNHTITIANATATSRLRPQLQL